MPFKSLEEQIGDKCKHFNGMINDECDAGVRYDDVKVTSTSPYRFPCLKGKEYYGGFCAKAEFPTPEEIAAEVKEINDSVKEFTDDLANNICPHCKKPMHKYQVGRCVYAYPCQHRLYQGTISE